MRVLWRRLRRGWGLFRGVGIFCFFPSSHHSPYLVDDDIPPFLLLMCKAIYLPRISIISISPSPISEHFSISRFQPVVSVSRVFKIATFKKVMRFTTHSAMYVSLYSSIG